MPSEDIVVIGAGPAGLATSACLRRQGVAHVVLERETIADARGRPNRFGEETGISGLYFVGFKNPPTGALREIALEAPRVARSIRAADRLR